MSADTAAAVHVATPHQSGMTTVRATLEIHDAAQQRMWALDPGQTGAAGERIGVDPRDVLTVLASATRAAEQLLCVRWCYVRDGLAAGLSLSELATAVGIHYSDELITGYRDWVADQQDLYATPGRPRLGFSDEQAAAALALLVAAPRWPGGEP